MKVVARDKTGKQGIFVPWDGLAQTMGNELDGLQTRLYANAEKNMMDNIKVVRTWKDFLVAIGKGYIALAPSVDKDDVEDKIVEDTREYFDDPDLDVTQELSGKAKTLCKPLCKANGASQEQVPERCLNSTPLFENLESLDQCKCFKTGEPATAWILWGRSY